MHPHRITLAAAIVCLLLAAPSLVAAHAEFVSSSPEEGQRFDEPPVEVVITFDSEIDPDGSEFIVTNGYDAKVGGGEADLDVAERNVMRGDMEITEPGTYTVSWAVVAEDGEEGSGEFTFIYGSEQPNTAVSAGTIDGPLVAAGLLLLAACGVTLVSLRLRALRAGR